MHPGCGCGKMKVEILFNEILGTISCHGSCTNESLELTAPQHTAVKSKDLALSANAVVKSAIQISAAGSLFFE
jgi:hypothetical protein